MTKPLAFREWRYPRTYRTVFAKEPRSIYQVDVMALKPLWKHIFDEFQINTKYRPKDYALVCIDVFSRYVWAVAMNKQSYASIAAAINQVFNHMGTPKFFQGDEKVIKSFEKYLHKNYPNVGIVLTKPYETNKNAIVERVIRTLKNDLLKYLYVREFPEIRGKFVGDEYVEDDTTSEVLQEICNMRNNTIHRTIRQKPIDVFLGRAPNRQIIVRKKYPQFNKDDLVLIKPIRIRGDIRKKIFDFDYNIYIIVSKEGDKYQVKSLYNFIHGIEEHDKTKKEKENYWYKPYELRKITPKQALEHLNSPIVQGYLYHVYEDPDAIKDIKKRIQSLL
jgi:hypothetical protein